MYCIYVFGKMLSSTWRISELYSITHEIRDLFFVFIPLENLRQVGKLFIHKVLTYGLYTFTYGFFRTIFSQKLEVPFFIYMKINISSFSLELAGKFVCVNEIFV